MTQTRRNVKKNQYGIIIPGNKLIKTPVWAFFCYIGNTTLTFNPPRALFSKNN